MRDDWTGKAACLAGVFERFLIFLLPPAFDQLVGASEYGACLFAWPSLPDGTITQDVGGMTLAIF